MLVLFDVHIRSYPLNEQQEQMNSLKEEIFPFEWRGPGTHCVVTEMSPWRHHIMELCDECDNCTKFQFYTEKVVRDIQFFVT